MNLLSLSPESVSRRKRPWKSLAAASVALFTVTAAIAVAAPADAADIGGITSVSIQAPNPADPTQPLQLYQRFTVDASWSLPAGAKVGDTFSLSFPSPVQSYAAQFPLQVADGSTVGTCAVTASSFVCTLTNSDYLATHTNINGTLYFQAQANATTPANTPFLFTTGSGVTLTASLPGGSIVGAPPTPEPTDPGKYGWETADGKNLDWVIQLPDASLAPVNGVPVTITDTFASALTLDTSSVSVSYVLAADWNGGNYGNNSHQLTEGTGANTFTVVNHPGLSSFDLTINQPVTNDGRLYLVQYSTTLPPGAPTGTRYQNDVAGVGALVSAAVTLITAGGTADGDTVPTPPVSTPDAPPATPAASTTVHLPIVSG